MRLAFNALDLNGKQLIIEGLVKDDLGNLIDVIQLEVNLNTL